MLAGCVIYIVYRIAHMHGTMVFAKALLCLSRCLMATQHALYVNQWVGFTHNPMNLRNIFYMEIHVLLTSQMIS